MKRKAIAVARGVLSHLPGLTMIGVEKTGGTNTARYCYSVWLRHLVKSRENGLEANPAAVAELGPGDSLGIGLAALISGAERYIALDISKYAHQRRNLDIFNELIALFEAREPIPGDDEFPKVRPRLKDYGFPALILTSARMEQALSPDRLNRIKEALESDDADNSMIRYSAPWYGEKEIEERSVDLLLSQAVLEHVDNLHLAYAAMRKWLKPSGHMSHTIDFTSHGLADEWNGHWRYSNFLWRLIRGRRPWLINRQPFSLHADLLARNGMSIVSIERVEAESKFRRSELAQACRGLREDDIVTRGVFLQARIQSNCSLG